VQKGVKMVGVSSLVTGMAAQKKPQGFQGAMEERLKKEMEDAEKLVRRPREVEDTLMKEHLAGKTAEGLRYNADMEVLQTEAGAARQALATAEANRNNKLAGVAAAEADKKAKDDALHQAAMQQQPYAALNYAYETEKAELAAAEANKAALQEIITRNAGQPGSQEVLNAQAAIVREDEKIKNTTTRAAQFKADMNNFDDPTLQAAKTAAADAGVKVGTLRTDMQKLNEAQKTAEEAVDKKETEIRARNSKLQRRVQEDAAAIVKGSGQVAEDYVTTKVHQRWTNYIPRVILDEDEGNDTMSKAMRKAAKAGIRDVNLKDQMKAWNALQREVGGGGGSAPTGPVAPAVSAPSGGGGSAAPSGGAAAGGTK